jgi:trans-aconitate 2-methyltransferase
MLDPVEPLILDLLEWIGPQSRAYSEVLEAWRTSCPRLPVWEEANRRGFVEHHHEVGHPPVVSVTPLGRAHLEARRARSATASMSTQPPILHASPPVPAG